MTKKESGQALASQGELEIALNNMLSLSYLLTIWHISVWLTKLFASYSAPIQNALYWLHSGRDLTTLSQDAKLLNNLSQTTASRSAVNLLCWWFFAQLAKNMFRRLRLSQATIRILCPPQSYSLMSFYHILEEDTETQLQCPAKGEWSTVSKCQRSTVWSTVYL